MLVDTLSGSVGWPQIVRSAADINSRLEGRLHDENIRCDRVSVAEEFKLFFCRFFFRHRHPRL
jgi:hypothetical protein